MCSTADRPESGVPPTGCSCHDGGGQRDRTGRGGPGDILQRLAVYQGRRAELCGATWQKLGHLRISAGSFVALSRTTQPDNEVQERSSSAAGTSVRTVGPRRGGNTSCAPEK